MRLTLSRLRASGYRIVRDSKDIISIRSTPMDVISSEITNEIYMQGGRRGGGWLL